ncbi:hypothetical protein QBC46DRAFT_39883 [Diplogelasinospora grovesii]|uniref:Uncharacterized protein n=1 Tax=Diplogelasinospora grovesii TaxID=303347 RepID=A0AAN6NCP9_9PEZI|nr:hypothetical protein QBC46DRAFT_39883 [Diplogelasinospora grovesii]
MTTTSRDANGAAIHGGTAPLAALTTIFTPPCPTSWLITTSRLLSQYPHFPGSSSFDSQPCDPPAWDLNLSGEGFQYYSPAICPAGFAVGPGCGLTKTRTAEGFPAVALGETAVWCVPSGFACTSDTSDFRGGIWGFTRGADAVTVGPAMQIRWVAADLSILETHPLTPGLTLAGRVASPATSTPSPGPSTSTTIVSTDTGPTSTMTTASPFLPTVLVTDSSTPSPVTAGPPTITDGVVPADATSSSLPSSTRSADSTTNSGALDPKITVVLLVLVSVLAGIAIWISAFFLIQRYRRRRAAATHHCEKGLPPPASVRLGVRRGRVYRYRGDNPLLSSSNMLANSGSISGAELGERDVLSELGPSPPRGTTPNPAELEGKGMGDPPVRWSWISQVSKLLNAPSWMGGSRARSPRLTRTPSSPTLGGGKQHRFSHPATQQTGTATATATASSPRTTLKSVRESFGEKINDPAAALLRSSILPGRAGTNGTRSTLRSSTAWSSRVSSPRMPGSPGTLGPGARESRDTFGLSLGTGLSSPDSSKKCTPKTGDCSPVNG